MDADTTFNAFDSHLARLPRRPFMFKRGGLRKRALRLIRLHAGADRHADTIGGSSRLLSRVFILVSQNPDTLVITAADADHPSLRFRDQAKLTYFRQRPFSIISLRQLRA